MQNTLVRCLGTQLSYVEHVSATDPADGMLLGEGQASEAEGLGPVTAACMGQTHCRAWVAELLTD